MESTRTQSAESFGQAAKCASIIVAILLVGLIDVLFLQQAAAIAA